MLAGRHAPAHDRAVRAILGLAGAALVVLTVLGHSGPAVIINVCPPGQFDDPNRETDIWIARGPHGHQKAPKTSVTADDFGPSRRKRQQVADAVRDYRQSGVKTPMPRVDLEGWDDYTTFASGMDDVFPVDPNQGFDVQLDRKRMLGIDFGPKFTGLALSFGGVDTIAMGTLETGKDWKATALKIAQMGSTRRVRDFVVGYPLDRDGKEGEVAKLVRHFSQVLADATLLLLGGEATVYLWDERYSTTYAAARLITRPNFPGESFRAFLNGKQGLDFSAKSLLDAEAARAILEHFADKDQRTDTLNRELAERVMPSHEACRHYLTWKRRQPYMKLKQPEEPAGPGLDGLAWDDQNAAALQEDEELSELRRRKRLQYIDHMDTISSLQNHEPPDTLKARQTAEEMYSPRHASLRAQEEKDRLASAMQAGSPGVKVTRLDDGRFAVSKQPARDTPVPAHKQAR